MFLTHSQVEQLAQACPGYELFVRVVEVVHTAVELNGEMTYGT